MLEPGREEPTPSDLSVFEPAAALETPEAIEAFLADVCESGDRNRLMRALGIAVRAKAIARFAVEAGQSTDALTVVAFIKALHARADPSVALLVDKAFVDGLYGEP